MTLDLKGSNFNFLNRFWVAKVGGVFVILEQSNFNYNYIICQQKQNAIILTLFLILPFQPLLPSPLKLQNYNPKLTLMSVGCVFEDLASLSHT